MYVAFFDLDHTILSTSSGRIIVRSMYRHGFISRKQIRRALFLSFVYRIGFLGAGAAVARWIKWFKGIRYDLIESLSAEWLEELKPLVREDARHEIEFHRSNGGKTVMLSASPAFICGRMRELLLMDDVICTELEVVGGRLSGRLKGRYCYGKEKLTRAKVYCTKSGEVMERAYYYADSINDLPVLESVGNPVCVTPDKRLAAKARSRGWKIVTWR
jgi:HAD superfamily hydrolase (TIGR01490 family)